MYTHVATVIVVFLGIIASSADLQYYNNKWGPYEVKYATFSEEERTHLASEAKRMFYFGYDNYLKHAFPQDELDPIHCTGRGPDYENPWVIKFLQFL